MTNEQYVYRIVRDLLIGCDEEVFWFRRKDGVIHAGVNCNDLFYWACADTEIIEPEDIDEAVALCKEADALGLYNGLTVWACKKRGQRPQKPYTDQMKPGLLAFLDKHVPETDETRGYDTFGEAEKRQEAT